MNTKPGPAAAGGNGLSKKKGGQDNEEVRNSTVLSCFICVSIFIDWQTFIPIDKKTVYTNKSDVVAKHMDFVVEYQDMKIFMQKYDLHNKLLGTGAFGLVKKATLKSNGE